MPSVPARCRPSASLGVLASGFLLLPLPGRAAPKADSCPPPLLGRYVVMERGSQGKGTDQQPLARLRQENWKADGTMEGSVFERSGKAFRQFRYNGTFRPLGSCLVRLERNTPGAGSGARHEAEAVLDAAGLPRYSLSLSPGSTITGVWRRQPAVACSAATLTGTVLSQQQGLSWKDGWGANAVVQRETWQNRRVQGVALSSYAGELETATYTGTIALTADCLATVVQRDSAGVDYHYRAVVMADGSGYFYLQEDPLDLTIGWLETVDPAMDQMVDFRR
ncbi:hypothetical protein H8F24_14900 [Synechococcus sp. CBW1002]|uniref:hypothetical protein n=1 Tax=Synechococcus sp. CBW1002 TaxID=1353134 RepID=UPI0018CDAF3C|nr:hypothetical protein [Synechococcus sp. CBW1002]QPN59308.1 hypothetical protein H8F24_14900 [Synechococcus sp. CBW1002]